MTDLKKQGSVILTDRYLNALIFMYNLHKNQTRKGSSIPYISHLESVASIVWKHNGSETEAIAALLHDAVEDQGGLETLQLIMDNFGPEIAQIVVGLSDTIDHGSGPKPEWSIRKQKYIDSLSSEPYSVRLISAADKLDNIRDILRELEEMGPIMWSKFSGTPDQIIWYYKSLIDIYIKHGPKQLGLEISQVLNKILEISFK